MRSEYHFYGTLAYVTSGTLRNGSHLMEMVSDRAYNFFIPQNATETLGKT